MSILNRKTVYKMTCECGVEHSLDTQGVPLDSVMPFESLCTCGRKVVFDKDVPPQVVEVENDRRQN
jgi:hypothetical protein